MVKYDLNEKEKTLIFDILGYLNFSSGSLDVQFAKTWNSLYESFSDRGSSELWRDALDALSFELEQLSATGKTFKDSRQSRRVLKLVKEALVEYRNFHEDTLFHAENSSLFNSFFMARVCRLAIIESLASDKPDPLKVVLHLNDFLGYRPIPVFQDGIKHDANEHEWIAPVPLYYRGAGIAFGEYREILEIAFSILRTTDSDILFDASFDLSKLREFSVDPRAYDFDHPVNHRPSYCFGCWDERSVGEDEYFHRFIVHRSTLDSIMSRIEEAPSPELRSEYIYEGASVLAGTVLMASGISGGYVQARDSSETIATLSVKIAAYRDKFYESLIKKVPAHMKPRLEAEAERLFQPFASARQSLNRQNAKKSADQLQRFALSRTYARMGYFEASKRQSDIIATASSRLLSRIDCYITKAHLDADAGKLDEAASCMPKIENLLHRGVACGAFPDPWFILGFDSQFTLFPAVENSVHDHRLDMLIDLLNDIFDLYSRLEKEAAASGADDLQMTLSDQMSDLAGWWDKYGSTEVSSVEGFSGQAAWESAAMVSTALAAWNKAGKAVGNVSFWRKHVERFKSPKAFVLLGEALLEKKDFLSSSSLLIYWLDQSDAIPLVESEYSFNTLAASWMEQVWQPVKGSAVRVPPRERNASEIEKKFTTEEYLKCWNMSVRFLDLLEANVNDNWDVPRLELSEENFDRKLSFQTDNPLLADLARRVILLTRPPTRSSPKIGVKPSVRDATRVFNDDNLPSPEEFEQFYEENRDVFPNYLPYRHFMEIFLNSATHISVKKREEYGAKVFGIMRSRSNSLSVSDPFFFPDGGKAPAPSAKNDPEKKKAWEEVRDSLELEDNNAEVAEKIQRLKIGQKTEGDATSDAQSEPYDEQDERVSNAAFFDDEDESEFDDDSDDENTLITGGDPTFSAAYENMTFRDSADDGNVDDTESGGDSYYGDSEGNNYEFARETDRITERLHFISMTVKLWKATAKRSPLLDFHTSDSLDKKTVEDAKFRLEEWLKHSQRIEGELFELLDQTSRFSIPKPSGMGDSLFEYDQLQSLKEILLDRVVWTIVEVADAILFLKATLRIENAEKYEKPWKTTALQTLSAIFHRDVKRARLLWPKLLNGLRTETLLYIPTARGGDAKAIVECRRLQQVVMRLLDYAPRLGLLKEEFQLIDCVQKMEEIRLSASGSITEYDRFVETAVRSVTETLAESSREWKVDGTRFQTSDDALVEYLKIAVDVALKNWLQHSREILISSIERIGPERQWLQVRNFIIEYGADLFTQHFLAFRNIRSILHQGGASFLATLVQLKSEDRELECGETLIHAIMTNKIEFQNAASIFEAILECVAENYAEYIDYNSTTTLSDHGEKLYVFLDFLRTLSKYERISWNLKPVYWTHDSLIRSCKSAANLWKETVKKLSASQADKLLASYRELTVKHGIWLQRVYERLHERFVRPLEIAQMCGLVADAISAVGVHGEDNPVFNRFEEIVESFAAEPCGVGFDLPVWLSELQDEVLLSRVDDNEDQSLRDPKDEAFESIPFPIEPVALDDVIAQFSDLDSLKKQR